MSDVSARFTRPPRPATVRRRPAATGRQGVEARNLFEEYRI